MKMNLQAFYSPYFLGLTSLGLLAWLLPPSPVHVGIISLVGYALVEEIVFRWGLQYMLEGQFSNRSIFLGISWANVLTSLCFALMHAMYHPPLWALGTFFPSLIFGWVWTRYQSILPCWAIHWVYNVFYFYRV